MAARHRAQYPAGSCMSGSYLLMSYPDGDPAALAIAEDAGPLRQVLTMVFRSMQ